jgi:hypothetical protein
MANSKKTFQTHWCPYVDIWSKYEQNSLSYFSMLEEKLLNSRVGMQK